MDEKTEWFQLGMDWPQQVAAGFPSKELLERAQLEKFRMDYLLSVGRLPFDNVRRGGNPPDFLVETDGGWVGLDCAAFTVESKRRAESLVTMLLERASEDGGKFEHLAGCDVQMSFLHGLPSPSDIATRAEIIRLLETAEVDRERIAQMSREVAAKGFPTQFPDRMGFGGGQISQSRFEGTFLIQVVPVPHFQPRSRIAAELGFNPLLRYSTSLKESANELQRLVESHDKPGIDHLLISAASPNRAGVCFQAEAGVAQILMSTNPAVPATSHLSKVTFHIWTTGQLLELPLGGST